MSRGNSRSTSSAGASSTGRLSPTKYYLSDLSSEITVIRRHHPLEGGRLEVLSATKACVVVRLADGSSLKLPRRWTDADGAACTELTGQAQISLAGLRELLRLFEALRRRMEGKETSEKIGPPQRRGGEADGQAAVAGVPRGGAPGEALGGVSGAGETGGDGALCAIDGARGPCADTGVEKVTGGGR